MYIYFSNNPWRSQQEMIGHIILVAYTSGELFEAE